MGCLVAPSAGPGDPTVNFAAHRESGRLVIDRMAGEQHGVLVPSASMFSDGPRFVLNQDGAAVAALWYPAAHMTVRTSANPESPVLGRVDASWDQGAIRLTLKPSDGPAVTTSVFHRISASVPSVLSGYARTIFDVRGVYRADVQDALGVPVGWLRVRISAYQRSPRIYEGVLPTSLNGALATTAVAMLDQEIDHIEDHVVNDVYQGLN